MKERSAALRHEGGLRFAVVTGTGRELAFGNDPERNEQSPVELVVAALAGCAAMDVATILAKKRQVVDRYAVTVRAVQREEHPRVLTTVELLHEVVGPTLTVEAVRRSIELSATKYCPVNAMLSAGVVRIRHAYRVTRTGPGGFESEGIAAETPPLTTLAASPEPGPTPDPGALLSGTWAGPAGQT